MTRPLPDRSLGPEWTILELLARNLLFLGRAHLEISYPTGTARLGTLGAALAVARTGAAKPDSGILLPGPVCG